MTHSLGDAHARTRCQALSNPVSCRGGSLLEERLWFLCSRCHSLDARGAVLKFIVLLEGTFTSLCLRYLFTFSGFESITCPMKIRSRRVSLGCFPELAFKKKKKNHKTPPNKSPVFLVFVEFFVSLHAWVCSVIGKQ